MPVRVPRCVRVAAVTTAVVSEDSDMSPRVRACRGVRGIKPGRVAPTTGNASVCPPGRCAAAIPAPARAAIRGDPPGD